MQLLPNWPSSDCQPGIRNQILGWKFSCTLINMSSEASSTSGQLSSSSPVLDSSTLTLALRSSEVGSFSRWISRIFAASGPYQLEHAPWVPWLALFLVRFFHRYFACASQYSCRALTWQLSPEPYLNFPLLLMTACSHQVHYFRVPVRLRQSYAFEVEPHIDSC